MKSVGEGFWKPIHDSYLERGAVPIESQTDMRHAVLGDPLPCRYRLRQELVKFNRLLFDRMSNRSFRDTLLQKPGEVMNPPTRV